uniref:Uncharacterized protein n=1 Tax=Cannabis sativa TaxID=3483 RepID=A0A803QJB2_CANSA
MQNPYWWSLFLGSCPTIFVLFDIAEQLQNGYGQLTYLGSGSNMCTRADNTTGLIGCPLVTLYGHPAMPMVQLGVVDTLPKAHPAPSTMGTTVAEFVVTVAQHTTELKSLPKRREGVHISKTGEVLEAGQDYVEEECTEAHHINNKDPRGARWVSPPSILTFKRLSNLYEEGFLGKVIEGVMFDHEEEVAPNQEAPKKKKQKKASQDDQVPIERPIKIRDGPEEAARPSAQVEGKGKAMVVKEEEDSSDEDALSLLFSKGAPMHVQETEKGNETLMFYQDRVLPEVNDQLAGAKYMSMELLMGDNEALAKDVNSVKDERENLCTLLTNLETKVNDSTEEKMVLQETLDSKWTSFTTEWEVLRKEVDNLESVGFLDVFYEFWKANPEANFDYLNENKEAYLGF